MKVQHVILTLSDGRKGLFTGKPFVVLQDGVAGVQVTDVQFTAEMEMKSGSIPVDVEEVVNHGNEREATDRPPAGEARPGQARPA